MGSCNDSIVLYLLSTKRAHGSEGEALRHVRLCLDYLTVHESQRLPRVLQESTVDRNFQNMKLSLITRA